MPVSAALIEEHKFINRLQTALMLAGIAFVLGLAGWSFGGLPMMLNLLFAGVLLLLISPRLSPRLILRMYRAEPLEGVPELTRIVAELARRAGLPRPPALYHVPSRLLNAFAVGSPDDAAIAVTDAMLHKLTLRELSGVLAHEISHIRHNDLRVMSMADALSRLTQSFSLVGQLMLFMNLPLILGGYGRISWLGIFLLIFAPQITALLQLALSRTREYDADLGAVELTGDPEGLASALAKLEREQRGFMEQIFLPNRRNPEPSLLRTHPPTEERIRRLLALRPRRADRLVLVDHPLRLGSRLQPPARLPHRHLWGNWY